MGKLPSPDEVRELVKDKIITQEEARDILFKEQVDGERDNESLKTEIKFLRELVDKLSSQQTTKVVEIIKTIEKPYYGLTWYHPYSGITLGESGNYNGSINCSFSSINNF